MLRCKLHLGLTSFLQQRVAMPPKRSSSGKTSAAKKLKLSTPGSLDHMVLPAELEGEIDFKPVCTTAEGLPWNLKIVSWNVNGIRAVLKSKKLHYLKFEDPDSVCLQETKCAEMDFPDEAKFLGYHKYYNSAQKKGYSSTALFSKVKPISVTYGINMPEHDTEGRVITAEYNKFYLVNVYVPNSGQKTVRLPYRRQWNSDFLAYCQDLDSQKPVVVAGDLNVAHTEIDLKNPKSNVKNSGFTPQEREDFTTWLDSGFVDTFRHFYPDKTGAYTFWTYMSNARSRNIGWRIDYFLISARFVNRVAASEMREKVLGSDHCPIMLLLADPGSEKSTEETEAVEEAKEGVKEAGEGVKEESIGGENETENETKEGEEDYGTKDEIVEKSATGCEDVENVQPVGDDANIKEKDGSVAINNGNQNSKNVEA